MDPRSERVNVDTDCFPIFVTGVNGSGKSTLIKNLHSNIMASKETTSWEINEYYDQHKKIIYLDMPFFDGYDRNYKEVARREHIIRDLAYQVQQSKGVI